jgi:flagellar biosynthesis protein FliQ
MLHQEERDGERLLAGGSGKIPPSRRLDAIARAVARIARLSKSGVQVGESAGDGPFPCPWYVRCSTSWEEHAQHWADHHMNPEFAVELLKTTMFQAVTLVAPILLTAMIIGLAISLFQAVTTISEQTLTFAPKALGIVALLVLLLPWMLRTTVEFTTVVIEKMPQMVR